MTSAGAAEANRAATEESLLASLLDELTDELAARSAAGLSRRLPIAVSRTGG